MFNEVYIKLRISKEGGKDESNNRNLQHWSSSASAGKARKPRSKHRSMQRRQSLDIAFGARFNDGSLARPQL